MVARAALIAVAAFVFGATPMRAVTLGFDDVAAPALFFDSAPLTDQFSAQGVVWSGGGAVLNSGGVFGVVGFSPPNFIAYNDSTIFSNGAFSDSEDTASFATAVSSVGFLVGANERVFPFGTSLSFSLVAFDVSGQPIDSSAIELTSNLQWIQVSGEAIARVAYGVSNGGFVVDDFTFLPVPEPSTAAHVILGLGMLGARRTRSRRSCRPRPSAVRAALLDGRRGSITRGRS